LISLNDRSIAVDETSLEIAQRLHIVIRDDLQDCSLLLVYYNRVYDRLTVIAIGNYEIYRCCGIRSMTAGVCLPLCYHLFACYSVH